MVRLFNKGLDRRCLDNPSQIHDDHPIRDMFNDADIVTDEQIEQVREWLYFIAERDNIDIREGLPKWIKREGAKAFEWKEEAYRGLIKGVLSHTNTNTGKCDIHPQQEMMDMLVSL